MADSVRINTNRNSSSSNKSNSKNDHANTHATVVNDDDEEVDYQQRRRHPHDATMTTTATSSSLLSSSSNNKSFVKPVPGASARSMTMILMLLTCSSLICMASLLYYWMEQQDSNDTFSVVSRWIDSYDQRHLLQNLFVHFMTKTMTLSRCSVLASLTILGWLLVITHLRLELHMSETNMPMLRSHLFLLGQAPPLLYHRPWDVFRAWHQQYGSVYTFPLFGQLFVSIADPYVLKLVLQSKIQHVRKDVVTAYKPFMDILGTGIVTSEDTAWMQQRVKMSHPLRVDILYKIPRITLQALKRLFQQLDEHANNTNNNNDSTLDLAEALRHLTLQVISNAFLSLSADESDRTFAKMYLPIVDEGNVRIWHPYRAYLPFMPSYWTHQHHVHKLNTYVEQLIQTRWQQRRARDVGNQRPQSTTTTHEEDILDQVLSHYEVEYRREASTFNSQQQQQQQEKLLPAVLSPHVIQQFRDEMKTFMLAGHETSAAMMTWTMIELLTTATTTTTKFGLAQRIVHEGLDAFPIYCDDNTYKNISLEELSSKLVWTEACLKESLRKYSVVPTITRRVVQDLKVPEYGYHIPKGATLILNLLTVHHNEQYWPRPMEYNPQRFLARNDDDDNTTLQEPHKEIEPFTFLAFIAGPRNCLGQYLSLLESKIVISMLMSRYEFTLVEHPTSTCPDDDGKSHPPKQPNNHGWLGKFDTTCWDSEELDPRHRFMVPVVPKGKVMVRVRKRITDMQS